MVASTRSSDHKGEATNGSADQTAGAKHQIDDEGSPKSKRAKKTNDKEQKTIEETING
jgi:hypothetical protein